MDPNQLSEHETAVCILEEGWKLFQQKGFRGVTVDELCERCKLTKPTLYYYFRDKENLFVQILQYKLHGFREIIERPGTLRARLEGIAATILDSFETEYSHLLRDREHLKRPENLARIRDAFYDELFGPLIALMQSGIAAGELRDDSPAVMALIFMGGVNNFIGKAAELHTDNPALARKLTDYFIAGARSRP